MDLFGKRGYTIVTLINILLYSEQMVVMHTCRQLVQKPNVYLKGSQFGYTEQAQSDKTRRISAFAESDIYDGRGEKLFFWLTRT